LISFKLKNKKPGREIGLFLWQNERAKRKPGEQNSPGFV